MDDFVNRLKDQQWPTQKIDWTYTEKTFVKVLEKLILLLYLFKLKPIYSKVFFHWFTWQKKTSFLSHRTKGRGNRWCSCWSTCSKNTPKKIEKTNFVDSFFYPTLAFRCLSRWAKKSCLYSWSCLCHYLYVDFLVHSMDNNNNKKRQ